MGHQRFLLSVLGADLYLSSTNSSCWLDDLPSLHPFDSSVLNLQLNCTNIFRKQVMHFRILFLRGIYGSNRK